MRVVSEKVVYLTVNAAYFGADNRVLNSAVCDCAGMIQRDQRAERVFVCPCIERARAVREAFGQHRHDLVRKIYARAAGKRLFVYRRTVTHIIRYVGDMHAEDVTVACDLKRNRVVQIFCVRAVDCKNYAVAQIQPAACGKRRRGGFFRRINGFLGKYGAYAMFRNTAS